MLDVYVSSISCCGDSPILFVNATRLGAIDDLYYWIKKYWSVEDLGPLPKNKNEAIKQYFADNDDEFLDVCVERVHIGN